MKIVFMVLGFLFLGASFAVTLSTEDEMRLAGGMTWVCEPPTASDKNTHCYTDKSSDTFLRLDLEWLPTTICLGLTGVGCMVTAAAVGNRQGRVPSTPAAYGPPAPAPYAQR